MTPKASIPAAQISEVRFGQLETKIEDLIRRIDYLAEDARKVARELEDAFGGFADEVLPKAA